MIPRQGCENLLSGNQEDRDKAGKTLNRGWFVLLDMIVEWSDTIASAFRVMAFARPYLRFGISEAVPTGFPQMKTDLIKRALCPFFRLRYPKRSPIRVR